MGGEQAIRQRMHERVRGNLRAAARIELLEQLLVGRHASDPNSNDRILASGSHEQSVVRAHERPNRAGVIADALNQRQATK